MTMASEMSVPPSRFESPRTKSWKGGPERRLLLIAHLGELLLAPGEEGVPRRRAALLPLRDAGGVQLGGLPSHWRSQSGTGSPCSGRGTPRAWRPRSPRTPPRPVAALALLHGDPGQLLAVPLAGDRRLAPATQSSSTELAMLRHSSSGSSAIWQPVRRSGRPRRSGPRRESRCRSARGRAPRSVGPTAAVLFAPAGLEASRNTAFPLAAHSSPQGFSGGFSPQPSMQSFRAAWDFSRQASSLPPPSMHSRRALAAPSSHFFSQVGSSGGSMPQSFWRHSARTAAFNAAHSFSGFPSLTQALKASAARAAQSPCRWAPGRLDAALLLEAFGEDGSLLRGALLLRFPRRDAGVEGLGRAGGAASLQWAPGRLDAALRLEAFGEDGSLLRGALLLRFPRRDAGVEASAARAAQRSLQVGSGSCPSGFPMMRRGMKEASELVRFTLWTLAARTLIRSRRTSAGMTMTASGDVGASRPRCARASCT